MKMLQNCIMGGGEQYIWVFHKRELSSKFWAVAPCNSLDKQILTLFMFLND